jgi:hypothetical protein
MDRTSPESLRRWALAWESAGAFLSRERASRLRAMTDDDVRAAVAALFGGRSRADGAERGTGLVEQQRLFRKLR